MSAFTKYPRTYCARCERRMLADRYYNVCWDCRYVLIQQAEKDAEHRSWRGFSDDERALNG
jgi:hypothetical protein